MDINSLILCSDINQNLSIYYYESTIPITQKYIISTHDGLRTLVTQSVIDKEAPQTY